MKCPGCGREMDYKIEDARHIDFSGTAEDEELEFTIETYTCRHCKITNENGTWNISENKQPTEKQKNTILFINSRLGMDLEAVTKRQCWMDTKKYFEKAKETPKYSEDEYLDMQEYFGFSEGDFC